MERSNKVITLARENGDPVAFREPAQWALNQLSDILKSKGFVVREGDGSEEAVLTIWAASSSAAVSVRLASRVGIAVPTAAESFSLALDSAALLACGADERGLVYALLELTDRVEHAVDVLEVLRSIHVSSEAPANRIRSIARLFTSELEDKPWFYDREFWDEYLTELATHRFNRFSLTLGLACDFGHDPGMIDNYMYFAYPFLLTVPGYDVKVDNLPDGEAARNLEMLQYIGKEVKRRGLHFQLGIWTQAYFLEDSPDARYKFTGITPENHALYCRDALHQLLVECPSIDGVTLRVHYESGISEPAHEFWRIVMSDLTKVGRPLEIDLHAKGADGEMLQVALDTGLSVKISPKFWAEHVGLSYHQGAIREMEMPNLTKKRSGFNVLTATRSFTRYGYADFLREDRPYGVLHRIWPGTQRLFLWGDPELFAGYGNAASFCGSDGMELCEPLSFKGRKNSGIEGGRDPYEDKRLQLGGREWRKYKYTYRLFGRLLYDPKADPNDWRRYLQSEFGDAAEGCEQALGYASRILPFITVTHLPSASNKRYWPEMYVNMPIVASNEQNIYKDSPQPHNFGASSPVDTELFSLINDYADDLVNGYKRCKYSPLDTALLLEEIADKADQGLQDASARIADQEEPSFRRLAVDVKAQIGIGRFFVHKFRAGVAYALFERTGDPDILTSAVSQYKLAKDKWEQVVDVTKGVYRSDVAFSSHPSLRGHWAGRLAAIETDIAAMERELVASAGSSAKAAPSVTAALSFESHLIRAEQPKYHHEQSISINRGDILPVQLDIPGASADASAVLHYRHANQAERFEVLEMNREGDLFTAIILGVYTDSPYPLLYYFELREGVDRVSMLPGLDRSLCNQPYYAVRVAMTT